MTTVMAANQCSVRDHGTLYSWPCQLAEGHEGAHALPLESRHYTIQIAEMPPERLAQELRLKLHQIDHMERERAEASLPQIRARLVARLIALAPANGTRKNVAAEDVRNAWYAAVRGEEP